eukprot:6215264-Prymnesium_polylepis.1
MRLRAVTRSMIRSGRTQCSMYVDVGTRNCAARRRWRGAHTQRANSFRGRNCKEGGAVQGLAQRERASA